MLKKELNCVRKLGNSRDHENREFVSHMNNASVSSSDFDGALHQILNNVSDGINCTECANCCIELQPLLSDADIKRFIKGLDISEEEFRETYISFDEERGGYCFHEKPCPFLKDNKCTNYEFRPEDCRSYPHLDSPEQIFRLWKTVYQCSICPIVHRVCEQLKEIYW